MDLFPFLYLEIGSLPPPTLNTAIAGVSKLIQRTFQLIGGNFHRRIIPESPEACAKDTQTSVARSVLSGSGVNTAMLLPNDILTKLLK